jgi:hypothetical protein
MPLLLRDSQNVRPKYFGKMSKKNLPISSTNNKNVVNG